MKEHQVDHSVTMFMSPCTGTNHKLLSRLETLLLNTNNGILLDSRIQLF